ncbi:MAG: hypothetical protein H0U76_13995 [Ktedonobacteraceae bacterium]|nr:hypothetical protein [Ktedonobacteraceae bacterium]
MSKDPEHDQPISADAQAWNNYPGTMQLGTAMRANNGQLMLFQNFNIRRVWHEGEWWYSLVDCMVPLSGTSNPRRYWNDLKNRLIKAEKMDPSVIRVLPLPNKDGRMRETDCTNQQGLLRVIQSVSHSNAEKFKVWLARVGKMVMDDVEEHSMRSQYRARLDQFDRELHELVEFHGVVTPADHYRLYNANYAGLYGVTGENDLLRMRPGVLPGDLETTMGSVELGARIFQVTMTANIVENRNVQGVNAVEATAIDAGAAIRRTIIEMGGVPPENLPQYPPLPPGEWMPPDHPNRMRWDEPIEEIEEQPIPIIEIRKPE